MKQIGFLRFPGLGLFGVSAAMAGALSTSAWAEFETPLAITNVKVVTGTGETIESATVLVSKGRIVAVGAALNIPTQADRFDATGLIAYPGFMDSHVHLGISATERTAEERQRAEDFNPDAREDAFPAMHGANRRGIRPEVRAIEKLAPDPKSWETHRAAGFTCALVAPRDGILGGTSDLINLSGDPIRRSILAQDVALHASFQSGEPGEYPQTLLGVFALFRQVMLDGRWYAKQQKFAQRHPDEAQRTPADAALEALQPVLARTRRVVFEANSEAEIRRALDLAKEFNLDVAISGGKEAWKVIDRLKADRAFVIVSLKYDEEPEFGKKAPGGRGPRAKREKPPEGESEQGEKKDEANKDGEKKPQGAKGEKKKDEKIYESLKVRREKRRLWEEQVANLIKLHESRVPFAIRSRDFPNPSELFKNLRLVMERGLTEQAALMGLAVTPGQLLAPPGQLGSIAPGRVANLTLMTKPLADEKAKVKVVFIDGKKFVIEGTDEEEGDESKEAKESGPMEEPSKKVAEEASTGAPGPAPEKEPNFAAEVKGDRIPRTRTGGSVLIKNATVLPISAPNLLGADILIASGKIAAIGRDLSVPEGVKVIDATGRYAIPGFVDCHSHLGLDGVNEGALSISAEVRIADVIDPDSAGIYRALAGGTTTHHAMHGSANTIGGQNVILKLKYGRPAAEMILPGGTRTIKFALGENVVQANFPTAWGNRFPNTRMGVESTLRAAFQQAQVYQQTWDLYEKGSQAGVDLAPPRRDLRLEALADVLAGKMSVHCHCYRSDEILRLLDVAEGYGIRIGCLHHVLEGYRIAPEIARHGCGASSFANMWAYKVEAYQAIPYNAAFLTRQGVNTSVNSDSSDTIRYLNQEAAKCVKWGGLTENEALRLVTLNPAMQLEIEDRVGSLEVGKDGDVAIFNGHPLNTFSKCVMTFIDGEVYFEDGSINRPSDDRRTQELAFRPPPPVVDRTIPQTPHRAYAMVHATVHTMASSEDPGAVIENGIIVVLDDKIHAVGPDVVVPPGAGIVDATGWHVYPGLIDAGATLGLSEIEMVRPTQDIREIGNFNATLLAATAVHPHSEHVPITRGVGITTCLTRPTGGQISGQSAVVRLHGWTASEMLLSDRFALHMSVPSLPLEFAAEVVEPYIAHDCNSDCLSGVDLIHSQGERPFRRRGPLDDEAKKKQREEHKKSLRELEEYITKAKHYARVKALAAADPKIEFETDLGLEAMIPFVLGEKPVALEAGGYKQILDTIDFAEKHGLKFILVRAPEAWKLADELAQKRIPVILSSPTVYPAGEYEPWDSVYRCAAELDRAGVKYCFGSNSTADAYNLAIEVGMAVAHGLRRERAEYALTQGAAEILGIADRVGSIEAGKQADLIVTTDSPLQATCQVTHLFIGGRPLDLSSLHTRNHEKFQSRPKPMLPPIGELRGPKSLTGR